MAWMPVQTNKTMFCELMIQGKPGAFYISDKIL